MEQKNNKLEMLEKLEDSIFPILLDAAKNKLSIKDAAKRAGMPYSSLQLIMRQIDLAHQNVAHEKNHGMLDKIKRLIEDMILKMESMTLPK